MNLKYAIQKKFPKSHASQFRVWNEDNKELFDYAAYTSGNYDKRLLDKVVIDTSVGTVLYSNATTMHITVDTGVKRMRELIEAATAIQQHCENSKCDSEECPFYKGFCVLLRDDGPAMWDLSKGDR